MKKLNLKGLTGDALTEHKNYKFFEQFVRIKTWNPRNWHNTDTSTSVVWRALGLGKIKTWDDPMKAIDTEVFQVYQRYAKSVDDNAILNVFKEIKPVPVISDASWTEKMARILSWKTNKQSETYVMMALGFDTLSVSAIKSHQNDQIFMVFWLLKNKNSLEAGKHNTEGLLRNMLKLDRLSPEEMAKSNKYQTFKYLSDLIKKNDIGEQAPALLQWLAQKR
ncbi:RxLR effector protein [Phytophthora megakarya]|uniref:RxLR effector protein n=1 Tax=Phytophthora megakarya TaxID=4795 RepID=A0A225UEF9_9STRA|nr:RxLR effector protein [Phytophthora megakarya]